MSKYKKGDRVRVCSLPPLDRSEPPTWVSSSIMGALCGKECIVRDIHDGYIELFESDGYMFNEKWLEDLTPRIPIVPIVKITDMGML